MASNSPHRDSFQSKESFFRLDPDYGPIDYNKEDKVLPLSQTDDTHTTQSNLIETPRKLLRNPRRIISKEINELKNFPCSSCERTFSTKSGRTNHTKKCVKRISFQNNTDEISIGNIHDDKQTIITPSHSVNPEISSNEEPSFVQIEEFYWGNKKGSEACKDINDCYEKIVFWKRNLFLRKEKMAKITSKKLQDS